jgi:hypothetical protein
MIFWMVSNMITGAISCWVVTYLLVRHREKLIPIERISMGVVAGCMILRMGPQAGQIFETQSPFDGWATSLMHIALTVLFVRWAVRLEHSFRIDRPVSTY